MGNCENSLTNFISIYLVKFSKVLDIPAFLAVPILKFASLSLVFALMGENKGNFIVKKKTTGYARGSKKGCFGSMSGQVICPEVRDGGQSKRA